MNITDVRIRKILADGRLKAIVSITIDNEFAVHDIKVIQGDDRMFIAMPSRKDNTGVFRDIVHPISPAARGSLEEIVMREYYTELEREREEQNDNVGAISADSISPSLDFEV